MVSFVIYALLVTTIVPTWCLRYYYPGLVLLAWCGNREAIDSDTLEV